MTRRASFIVFFFAFVFFLFLSETLITYLKQVRSPRPSSYHMKLYNLKTIF